MEAKDLRSNTWAMTTWALDVAKRENPKNFPLSAHAIPYALKCRHCCIEGRHYEVE